jgi:hypothetical protein
MERSRYRPALSSPIDRRWEEMIAFEGALDATS